MERILEGKGPLEESLEDLEEREKEISKKLMRQDLFQGALKEAFICVSIILTLRY